MTSVKALTVRLPDDLHREAKLLSVQRGESLNSVLRDLLQKWVAHYEEKK
jgi:predicted HicB family RNase H-like nuclease